MFHFFLWLFVYIPLILIGIALVSLPIYGLCLVLDPGFWLKKIRG